MLHLLQQIILVHPWLKINNAMPLDQGRRDMVEATQAEHQSSSCILDAVVSAAWTLAVPPTRCYSSPAWTLWAPGPAAVWLPGRPDDESGADDECGRSKQQRFWRRVLSSSTLSPYRRPDPGRRCWAVGAYVTCSDLQRQVDALQFRQIGTRAKPDQCVVTDKENEYTNIITTFNTSFWTQFTFEISYESAPVTVHSRELPLRQN